MRLYSSVIRLISTTSAVIPIPGGQHAHAAFLDIVRQVDPELSQKLHDTRGKGARQPFTVSPIMGMPKPRISEVFLRAGWECWLRVTMLDDALFKTFIEYFMAHPSPTFGRGARSEGIRLGDAHFLVSEILTTPGSHPWAGYITLEELQKRLEEPAPMSIAFELFSPTSFKLRDETIETIPYPKLAFGSLATAWKALTGENMVEAVEKYAGKNIRPALHRIERQALTLHNHPQLGSVGRVEYQRLDDEDTPLARGLNLLADLAFYTGLGRKTAQGMGMARRIQQIRGPEAGSGQ